MCQKENIEHDLGIFFLSEGGGGVWIASVLMLKIIFSAAANIWDNEGSRGERAVEEMEK